MPSPGGSTQHHGLRAVSDPALANLPLDAFLSELTSRAAAAVGSDEAAIVLDDGRVYGNAGGELCRLADAALQARALQTAPCGAALPLLTRQDAVGALAIATSELSDEALDVLHIAASRAAVAVEHTLSLEAERRARRRLEDLQAVTDAALAHLELPDLLDELLLRIRSILGTDTAAILLLDENTNELVARAARGIEEEVEAGVRIPLGQGFAGRVAAERRPVILPDVDHAHVLNPILREKGIKSLLGVPLLIEGNPIGVLHVGTLTPREFTPGDVDILQLVADRAALAIEHARVYAAERRARTRLEHVQAVTDAAISHLDLGDLLDELLLRIRSILGVDTAAVLLLDESTNELVATAARGIEEEVEAGVRIPVGGGFAGRVAAERQPVILPNVDHTVVLNPILIDKGIKTLLGVPLFLRGEVIGVMHVGTLRPHEFREDDVELLQLVAERAALAIERARLHEEAIRFDELQQNFVAIASHELRTPAASVYGALATLRGRGDELPEATRAQLSEIAWTESDRMRRLIEQLLDLSRLDAGRIEVAPRPLDVRTFLEELVHGIDGIEVVADPGLEVMLDPLVVERVVANLLANARTYGRPPIRLSAERMERRLLIAVEDSGPGVPDALVPVLFDRFVRGDDGRGTGLGLAIARAYATAHGGELRYESGAAGARFELVLPAV